MPIPAAPPVTSPALPIYRQVAELLARQIRAGYWHEGERLPPEADLAVTLGVAVGTLRKALAMLAEQELLERVQGSGTYVKRLSRRRRQYELLRLELRHTGPGLPTARILALGLEGLERHIRTIGLYRSKARHLIQTCEILLARHGGQVPRSREALEALPGVGRKTANVVLNVAFGENAMAVDTHIFRLGNRTGIAPGRTPREVEDGLLARCPPGLLRDAHHWLILHGRYVCKARMPEWQCCRGRRARRKARRRCCGRVPCSGAAVVGWMTSA